MIPKNKQEHLKNINKNVGNTLYLILKQILFCHKSVILHFKYFNLIEIFSKWAEATLNESLPIGLLFWKFKKLIVFFLFTLKSNNLISWCSGPIRIVNKSIFNFEMGFNFFDRCSKSLISLIFEVLGKLYKDLNGKNSYYRHKCFIQIFIFYINCQSFVIRKFRTNSWSYRNNFCIIFRTK